MNDQFVTYEIAKRLKALGFEGQCFAEYCQWDGCKLWLQVYQDSGPEDTEPRITECSAPLWQQAIDWLREKHGYVVYIKPLHEIHPEKRFVGYTTSFTNDSHFDSFYNARETAILIVLDLIDCKQNEKK
jgi:hypothetical protein